MKIMTQTLLCLFNFYGLRSIYTTVFVDVWFSWVGKAVLQNVSNPVQGEHFEILG